MIPDSKRARLKQNKDQASSVDQSHSLLKLDLDEENIAEMASDPEIQKELQLIDDEFSETEEDGLSD